MSKSIVVVSGTFSSQHLSSQTRLELTAKSILYNNSWAMYILNIAHPGRYMYEEGLDVVVMMNPTQASILTCEIVVKVVLVY